MAGLVIGSIDLSFCHWVWVLAALTYDCRLANKLGVAQNKGQAVVVDMEEGQIVSLEDEENSIKEFPDLEEIVDVVEGLQTSVEDLCATDRGEETVLQQAGDDFGHNAQ